MTQNKHHLNIYVNESLARQLEKNAQRHGISVSSYGRLLLHRAIDDNRSEKFVRFVLADGGKPEVFEPVSNRITESSTEVSSR